MNHFFKLLFATALVFNSNQVIAAPQTTSLYPSAQERDMIYNFEIAKMNFRETLRSDRQSPGLFDRANLPPSIQGKKLKAALVFIGELDKAFLSASGGKYNHAQFCKMLAKDAKYSEAYRKDYQTSVCLSMDWKSDVIDWKSDINKLFDQVCYNDVLPYICHEDRMRSFSQALTWLIRNDGSSLEFYDRQEERAYENCVHNVYPEQVCGDKHIADTLEVRAIEKLLNQGVSLKGKILSTPVKDHKDDPYVILNADVTPWLMKEAFGYIKAGALPAQINGFHPDKIISFFREFSNNSYVFAHRVYGNLYYDIRVFQVLSHEFQNELDIVFNQKWFEMPLDTGALWTLRELSVTSKRPLANFTLVMPNRLYIAPIYYQEYMALYRANKTALIGDQIVAAIQELKTSISADLNKLSGSVSQSGVLTQESIASLSREIGPSLKSIKHSSWASFWLK